MYNKIGDTWKRIVVEGVQWSENTDRTNNNGQVSVAHSVTVTFPKPTFIGLVLDSSNEEDCIVFGEVTDVVADIKGCRISDLLKKYPKSGLIKSVNDNSNRAMLPNIKVVLD